MAEESSVGGTVTPVPVLPPGQLVRRLLQAYQAAWVEHVDDVVTPAQSAVLTAVRDHPGVEQGSLGASVSIDRSTMANIVARLSKRGLITREKSPTDGRKILLALTDEGAETTERVVQRAVALDGLLMAEYGPQGRTVVIQTLRALADEWEQVARGVKDAGGS